MKSNYWTHYLWTHQHSQITEHIAWKYNTWTHVKSQTQNSCVVFRSQD